MGVAYLCCSVFMCVAHVPVKLLNTTTPVGTLPYHAPGGKPTHCEPSTLRHLQGHANTLQRSTRYTYTHAHNSPVTSTWRAGAGVCPCLSLWQGLLPLPLGPLRVCICLCVCTVLLLTVLVSWASLRVWMWVYDRHASRWVKSVPPHRSIRYVMDGLF